MGINARTSSDSIAVHSPGFAANQTQKTFAKIHLKTIALAPGITLQDRDGEYFAHQGDIKKGHQNGLSRCRGVGGWHDCRRDLRKVFTRNLHDEEAIPVKLHRRDCLLNLAANLRVSLVSEAMLLVSVWPDDHVC